MIPNSIIPNAICVILEPIIGKFFLFNPENSILNSDRFLGNKSTIEAIKIHTARDISNK